MKKKQQENYTPDASVSSSIETISLWKIIAGVLTTVIATAITFFIGGTFTGWNISRSNAINITANANAISELKEDQKDSNDKLDIIAADVAEIKGLLKGKSEGN